MKLPPCEVKRHYDFGLLTACMSNATPLTTIATTKQKRNNADIHVSNANASVAPNIIRANTAKFLVCIMPPSLEFRNAPLFDLIRIVIAIVVVGIPRIVEIVPVIYEPIRGIAAAIGAPSRAAAPLRPDSAATLTMRVEMVLPSLVPICDDIRHFVGIVLAIPPESSISSVHFLSPFCRLLLVWVCVSFPKARTLGSLRRQRTRL